MEEEPEEREVLFAKGFWRRARLAALAARRMSGSGSFCLVKRFWRSLSAASLVATMDWFAR